ncbi:hypothetical protein DY000_02008231 [Brassica cretica]|uniref:SWIM-type domain-containing protein n=1 Tax=Brassica cretica TaxID=69181 RepID=A0ABQ7C7G8_BRACR|nr:hypothetical protein DY000_02008231 [Brassica cretica]
MHIYASCGLCKFDPLKGWGFAVDKNKRGRVLYMELTRSFEDLRRMAFKDFGIDQNLVELELSYLPMELISSIDCPPVIIESDRQVKNFRTYVRGKASTRLCVSTLPISGNNNNIGVDNEKSNSPFREQGEPSSFPLRDDIVSSSESSKDVEDNCNSNGYEEDDVLAISAKEDDSGKSVRFSWMDVVKRSETFQNKTMLKAALEMSAMKHNFNYKVVKSDKKTLKRFQAVCNISPTIGKYSTDADVTKWARCQFRGFMYDIRTTNPAESINSVLRTPREYPVIPLLDSIREMLTRWFFERRTRSRKHTKPLTIAIEKKIDRRINKGKKYLVQPVDEYRFLVRGDTIDCLVDLDKRTCSCGNDLLKIPCRHAIKAGLTVDRAPSSLTDDMYTTSTWRTSYQETINPVRVPEDSWVVPDDVRNANVVQEEEHEGEESAYTRRLKTNSVHRKELKKKRSAYAVDVAKIIITELHVTELFNQFVVLDFLGFD